MTAGGWILMIVSVGGVTAFFAWCLYSVLSRPRATEHVHSPVDIDTHDRE